jgi:phosphoribosyl 1,2-cyclic phosphate phosphodiesterase
VRITILGSGGASGVPAISVGWAKCDPKEPKNRRRRPSILVEEGGRTILVDTSPDLRDQLLDTAVRHLDAILYTHTHADHLNGIDDLREVNRAMGGPIAVYGTAETLADIRARFAYVFEPLDLKTVPIYKPLLEPHVIDGPFRLGEQEVIPVDQDHGYSRTTGFRFGQAAYSTDLVDLPEASMAALRGLDLWIVGCLMDKPHPTHAHLAKVLGWAKRLAPKLTVITHMSPWLDYARLQAELPPGVVPGYDGMVLEL